MELNLLQNHALQFEMCSITEHKSELKTLGPTVNIIFSILIKLVMNKNEILPCFP
jgi:hypothetical protein